MPLLRSTSIGTSTCKAFRWSSKLGIHLKLCTYLNYDNKTYFNTALTSVVLASPNQHLRPQLFSTRRVPTWKNQVHRSAIQPEEVDIRKPQRCLLLSFVLWCLIPAKVSQCQRRPKMCHGLSFSHVRVFCLCLCLLVVFTVCVRGAVAAASG